VEERAVQFAAAASGRLLRGRDRTEASSVPPGLVSLLGAASPAEALRVFRAGHLRESVQVLRSYLPGGWRPHLRVNGREHIDAGLARGHGVILWVGLFVSSNIVTKMALADAGYRVTHLSRPSHPFSGSRFGVRLLNPVQRRVEDRHLEERLLFTGRTGVGALRSLHERLRENRVVSITVGDIAQNVVELPILGGRVSLAVGPLQLASTTAAALLPVFSVRTAPDAYAVNVESPLALAAGERRAAFQAALETYVQVLESYVRRYPDQWFGWRR